MRLVKMITGVLLAVWITACSNDNDGSVDREFYLASILDVSPTSQNNRVRLESGDNLVFRYSLNYPEDPDIADDELSEVFWFEIPAGETEFEYTMDDGITEIPLAYQRLCFCAPVTYTFLSAQITARQTNPAEWFIAFEIQARDSENLLYPLRDEGYYRLVD